ncbi:MAG: SRPBCC family protein [Microthrixaceae bacterium]
MIETETKVVRHELRIAAAPEVVWKYWTDPRRMCQWWGREAELDARPGGPCVVRLGDGAVMRGEYVELDPYERIVFTFGWDPSDDGPPVAPGSSRVEVSLAEIDGQTDMTLVHSGLPIEALGAHNDGWAYFTGELNAAASAAEW